MCYARYLYVPLTRVLYRYKRCTYIQNAIIILHRYIAASLFILSIDLIMHNFLDWYLLNWNTFLLIQIEYFFPHKKKPFQMTFHHYMISFYAISILFMLFYVYIFYAAIDFFMILFSVVVENARLFNFFLLLCTFSICYISDLHSYEFQGAST